MFSKTFKDDIYMFTNCDPLNIRCTCQPICRFTQQCGGCYYGCSCPCCNRRNDIDDDIISD